MAGLSRRALIGTGTGLALAGSAAAAPKLTSGSDAHLLALCADAMRLDLGSSEADDAGRTDEACDMLTQWFAVAEQIAATSARTPAGIRAKAGIVRHLMTPASHLPEERQDKWDDAGVYGPLTWSLVNDLAALAA